MAKVQFNLLPDIKVTLDQARRTQKRVTSIATLVTAVIMVIFVIVFVATNLLQKKLLSSADTNIKNYQSQLSSIKDLPQILTIQNQLTALPALHQSKHIDSRLFDYLPNLLPPGVGLNKIDLDNTANTIAFAGSAKTVADVNTLVDTLKFTNFTTSSGSNKTAAFTSVVLSSVGRDASMASFTITTTFNPALFDASQNVTLIVPQQLTTRSITDAPAPTFNGQPTQSSGGTK